MAPEAMNMIKGWCVTSALPKRMDKREALNSYVDKVLKLFDRLDNLTHPVHTEPKLTYSP